MRFSKLLRATASAAVLSAVCAGAAYDVDPQAVAKFSRTHGVRIDKLVFYKQTVSFYEGKTHKSEFVGHVPPYTLIAVAKDDVATEDWHPLIASTGVVSPSYTPGAGNIW